MNRFQDKRVWITGASSGIGEASAYGFAHEGAKLVLTARSADSLRKVADRCLELGAPATEILPYDLVQKDGLADLAQKAWNVFDGLDIFFSNAGISQRGTTVETSMEVIEKVMDVNWYAPVIITKVLLPLMIGRGGGQIAVTTSINGRFGFPLRCAYSSSKHALYGFFETVQAEYWNNGIRVTMVCPGRVQTRISFNALEKDGSLHGRMDEGQASGCTSEEAAKKIVKAIYNRKREVLVGRKELLMVYIKRFFPCLAARIARSIKAM